MRVNEFEALMSSLGEHVVGYIGQEHLARLFIYGDEVDLSASIEIFLEDESWASRTRAIDKMVEIREMFIDEISIDYRFVHEDSETIEAAHARRADFAMA
jgi:hypothetical protein